MPPLAFARVIAILHQAVVAIHRTDPAAILAKSRRAISPDPRPLVGLVNESFQRDNEAFGVASTPASLSGR
jgi:hypothetical protein